MDKQTKKNIIKILLVITILLAIFLQFIFSDKKREKVLEKNTYNYINLENEYL